MIFISFNLLKFFSLLAMISSFMIIISRNPIFSVLYLILSFFNISATIFLLELEFLPIVFLVVYVGAVAVLFLFVLMMLNIKIAELKETTYHYLPIAIIFFFIFDSQFRWVMAYNFSFHSRLELYEFSSSLSSWNSWSNEIVEFLFCPFDFYFWFFKQSNVFYLGDLLFTNFCFLFLMLAFILLLAMVGTIALTLQKKFTTRTQQIYKQVLRNSHEAIKIIDTSRVVK